MKRELEPELLDDLQKLGEQIKLLRKNKTNLNFRELSKQTKISERTYLRIENATDDYSFSSLWETARYFDIKLSDLFRQAGL